MFRIITFNANGIRSASRKGFFTWLRTMSPDVLCMQELKAQESDLTEDLRTPLGFRGYFHCAQKKGYSGCGLWSRVKPFAVRTGFGNSEFDAEGRYVEADFGSVIVISVYFPSGSSSDDRQSAKFRFLDAFKVHMDELRQSGREVIICGDINIAHKEIDLKNWKGNLDHSGFYLKSVHGLINVSGKKGGLTFFECSILGRSDIPGGVSEDRLGQRMSVGVLITKLLRPALLHWLEIRGSSQTKNFRIMRPYGWTMT